MIESNSVTGLQWRFCLGESSLLCSFIDQEMGEGKGIAEAAEQGVWSHSQWTSAIAEKSFSIFFLAPFQKKKKNPKTWSWN